MADVIFIDANKYLDFYRVSDQEIVASLTALAEHSACVFVTSQIVDEVKRNKLGIAIDFMGAYRKSYETIQIDAEPWYLHQERTKSGDFKVKVQKNLREELEQKIEQFGRAVSRSEDVISEHLKPIFDKAHPLNDTELLNRARRRRELGNPPGKKGDPLGDQLSWEQLLASLGEGDRLWLVSADKDYSSSCGKIRILNAHLHGEVVKRTKAPDSVFCFDNLANALTDFKKKHPGKKLEPKQEEELERAAEAERSVAVAPGPRMWDALNARYLAGTPEWIPPEEHLRASGTSFPQSGSAISGPFAQVPRPSSLHARMFGPQGQILCPFCGSDQISQTLHFSNVPGESGTYCQCQRCGAQSKN